MYRLVCFLAAVALTLLAGFVFAQNPGGAVPVPISIGAHSSVPTGLQSTVTFDARGVGGAANAGYYSKPVLVSNNTLGGLAKGLARRAAPVAAMTAAIAAAGWVIDELTGQVLDGPVPEAAGPVPPGGVYYVWGNKYYSSASAAFADIKALMDYPGAPHTSHRYSEIDFQADADTRVLYVCHHAETWSASQHLNYSSFYEKRNATAFPQAYPWADPVVQPQPVPDAALGQLVKDNPALWNQALHNADGSVNRNPDVMAAANALAAELAANAPAPDPTAEWDTGNQGGNPSPSGMAAEWPTFCAWATKVCELADWMREPPDPDQDRDLPREDLPSPVAWNSSLGQGSCPAPHPLNLNMGQQFYDWAPWCDLASRIKPLVIASASFAALLILAGVSRRSNGDA